MRASTVGSGVQACALIAAPCGSRAGQSCWWAAVALTAPRPCAWIAVAFVVDVVAWRVVAPLLFRASSISASVAVVVVAVVADVDVRGIAVVVVDVAVVNAVAGVVCAAVRRCVPVERV